VIKCLICGKKYKRVGWIVRHIRQEHCCDDMAKLRLVQAIWVEEIVKGVKRYSKAYEVKE